MVSDVSSDAVFGFAKQGHPQAIAVLLNRELVSDGAHVKVRQKDTLLKVLINFLRDTDLDLLVSRVQETLNDIAPKNVDRVQIFTQRLGDRQAAFRKEIGTASNASQNPPTNSVSSKFEPAVPKSPAQIKLPPKASPNIPAQQHAVTPEPVPQESTRYSVAEYLSQVTDVEDLRILEDHPFFTAVCPNCHYGYTNLDHPPLFWDCPSCGWRDDLSQKVPRSSLRETPQSQQISQGKLLGSYLIEAGLLSPAQIEVALADQQLNGVRLGEVLVRRGWIKEETVEYLMRKVIEPERQSSSKQAEAYLESSRNLLKTLMQQNKEQQETEPEKPVVESKETQQPTQKDSAPSKNQINERETLILGDLDLSKMPVQPNPNLVNERETLLLPESDLSDLIQRESDQ